jgi:hypothetical protein
VTALALGQIRKLDLVADSAVIALEDGREVTVTFPPGANIEVHEPATMGTMGGTLADLQVGYWVDATIHEHADHACSCTSLLCVS